MRKPSIQPPVQVSPIPSRARTPIVFHLIGKADASVLFISSERQIVTSIDVLKLSHVPGGVDYIEREAGSTETAGSIKDERLRKRPVVIRWIAVHVSLCLGRSIIPRVMIVSEPNDLAHRNPVIGEPISEHGRIKGGSRPFKHMRMSDRAVSVTIYEAAVFLRIAIAILIDQFLNDQGAAVPAVRLILGLRRRGIASSSSARRTRASTDRCAADAAAAVTGAGPEARIGRRADAGDDQRLALVNWPLPLRSS